MFLINANLFCFHCNDNSISKILNYNVLLWKRVRVILLFMVYVMYGYVGSLEVSYQNIINQLSLTKTPHD